MKSIASTIHRVLREIDNDTLNNFTIKHTQISTTNSNKNDTINSNMSQSHAYGYHNDDRTIITSGAHSLPVVAPAEPKSKQTHNSILYSASHHTLND